MVNRRLFTEESHRRLNILTGEWVLVSPRRIERPWQGRVEPVVEAERPPYDPTCYLCPGNERAGGKRVPLYEGAWVFENDFPALRSDAAPHSEEDDAGLLITRPESGICRVVCFSPRHDLSLPELSLDAIVDIVQLWTNEYLTLGARPDIGHVQIFENKGEMMGCSNPHPHGQIWAQRSVPCEPTHETARFEEYFARHDRTMLADYLALEIERDERIVCANDGFVALVPFWAVWPFETLVVSRRPVPHLGTLDDAERRALADIIKRLTTRYDNLFHMSFPYSAGIHQSPTDDAAHAEWHLHMHFYPPLLRSATIRKFLVGYEMLGEPQRDLTPEAAADRLRSSPEIHYRRASL